MLKKSVFLGQNGCSQKTFLGALPLDHLSSALSSGAMAPWIFPARTAPELSCCMNSEKADRNLVQNTSNSNIKGYGREVS